MRPRMAARETTNVRIHYLQHVPAEGLGAIETWAGRQGAGLSATHLYAGQSLPELDAFDWLIVMGGPMNIYEEEAYPWLRAEKRFIRQAIGAGKVVLGFCLGGQLIADALGARVARNPQMEIGWFELNPAADLTPPLERLLPGPLPAFHWHGDRFELPEGARLFARSEACDHQGFTYGERVYAFQFHAEITPELASRFIEAEGTLPQGEYVQSPDAMLADAKRFRELNRRLFGFLDALALVVGTDDAQSGAA
jgi:GMP synthase-like glutamine amidotransferase